MWRAPHLAILKNVDVSQAALRPIVAPGMSPGQLESGMWRLLRILPTAEKWRRLAMRTMAHADPFSPDAHNRAHLDASPGAQEKMSHAKLRDDIKEETEGFRDHYLICLIGHTVTCISCRS